MKMTKVASISGAVVLFLFCTVSISLGFNPQPEPPATHQMQQPGDDGKPAMPVPGSEKMDEEEELGKQVMPGSNKMDEEEEIWQRQLLPGSNKMDQGYGGSPGGPKMMYQGDGGSPGGPKMINPVDDGIQAMPGSVKMEDPGEGPAPGVNTQKRNQNFRMKFRPQMMVKPVNVSIKNTTDMTSDPLRIKCKAKINWSKIPSQYAYVWLQVCKSDKSSCGGAISVSNNGFYGEFRPDTSMVEQNLVIKLYTHDKKYTGKSNKFTVNGMLMECCPDGTTFPPCK